MISFPQFDITLIPHKPLLLTVWNVIILKTMNSFRNWEKGVFSPGCLEWGCVQIPTPLQSDGGNLEQSVHFWALDSLTTRLINVSFLPGFNQANPWLSLSPSPSPHPLSSKKIWHRNKDGILYFNELPCVHLSTMNSCRRRLFSYSP